jgi:hypothetical protein
MVPVKGWWNGTCATLSPHTIVAVGNPASGQKLGQGDFAEGGTRLFHLTAAPKGSWLDHAICDRGRGNRHQNSHAQSRSVRTPDGRSEGDQSRSVGSLGGKSRRGTRSSGIRQIRRKLRQAIPSPMGYPNPSPMDNTDRTRGNTLENNKDSLASERGWLPISCRQQ